MAKDDYFVIVYAILKYLYDCLKSGETADFEVIRADSFSIPESYWRYIIEYLKKDGLIDGVTVRETKTGMLIQDRGIRITPRGISFLFENSLMEKVKRTLKDIKEIIPFA